MEDMSFQPGDSQLEQQRLRNLLESKRRHLNSLESLPPNLKTQLISYLDALEAGTDTTSEKIAKSISITERLIKVEDILSIYEIDSESEGYRAIDFKDVLPAVTDYFDEKVGTKFSITDLLPHHTALRVEESKRESSMVLTTREGNIFRFEWSLKADYLTQAQIANKFFGKRFFTSEDIAQHFHITIFLAQYPPLLQLEIQLSRKSSEQERPNTHLELSNMATWHSQAKKFFSLNEYGGQDEFK